MKLPDTVVRNNKNIKILTPNGYQPFLGVNKIKKDKYIHLTFEDGSELKCSLDHPLSTIEGIIKAKDLDNEIEVYTKEGGTFLKNYKIIEEEVELYDIVNSGIDHLYYSNNLVSHNCSFLGSVDTLVSSAKLQCLVYNDPIKRSEGLDVYENPIVDHNYMITVDVSEGTGKDYHAFVVIDITSIPYKLVAKYRNNELKPMLLPDIIYKVATSYNKAYVLIEIASVGDQVAKDLMFDLEYENILMCSMRGRAGQLVGQGFSGKTSQRGIKMSKQVKRVGCSNLKTIIEDDKLIINDFDIISELTTFVSKNNSFEGEIGCNDDLSMCLVIFSWLIVQDYFKEMTNNDVRKRIYEEQKDQIEQDMSPFGFINDGVINEDEDFIEKETGDYWLLADNNNLPLEVWNLDEYGDISYMWNYR
jgi:hypothetical protein